VCCSLLAAQPLDVYTSWTIFLDEAWPTLGLRFYGFAPPNHFLGELQWLLLDAVSPSRRSIA